MESDKLQIRAFHIFNAFLNDMPDMITQELVEELMAEVGCSETHAFALLIAAAAELDTIGSVSDKELFLNYLEPAIRLLDIKDYTENPYYKNVRIPTVEIGRWKLHKERYKPYEAFVCDDILLMPDEHQVPQIGFFKEEFSYPAVLENGRIWMTVTPNEVETMKLPIQKASKRVLTYGLGLGYYTYMVSEKPDVETVTVVERDSEVIKLFTRYILPQIPQASKIRIVQSDAFEYATHRMPKERFDFVFTDLWHDVSDGIPMYRRMKLYEKDCPQTQFMYWIEKSMRCYL